MLYYLYYASYLLLIPTFIFTLWAQINVNSTFKKNSGVSTRLCGADAARRILDANGLHNVRIERVRGHLSDHYDPKANVIRLSDAVYSQYSAAAVGVAAHEAGHAVQHATGYAAIKLRMAIIPVCSIGSYAAMPLFLLGLMLSSYSYNSNLGYYLMIGGILFYSLAVLFQLVTLPVEFDASRRAMEALNASADMSSDETRASRKVLTAAALTYVAALASALLSLLRLVLIAAGGRRRS